jgi:cysteine desulfurase
VRAARPQSGSIAEAIPVGADGAVDLDALDALLRSSGRPALVSVMAANNETGILQPIAAIAECAHGHGALMHCDAVQAIGRTVFDMASLGVDLVTISAHKLGGPPGVGALAVADGVPLAPMLTGGGQEAGLRAGTENVAGIVGFGLAIAEARGEIADWDEVAALRDAMEARLRARVPDAVFIGAGAPRLPNTSCAVLPGVPTATQIMALDLDGIAVSAGAACSSGKLRPSHVLEAMGVAPALAACAIRISLGRATTDSEIDRLVAAWSALAARAGSRAA